MEGIDKTMLMPTVLQPTKPREFGKLSMPMPKFRMTSTIIMRSGGPFRTVHSHVFLMGSASFVLEQDAGMK